MILPKPFLVLGVYGSAALFAIYAVLILRQDPMGFVISGHSSEGMVPAMAGRYFMMMLLVMGFWWLKDFRALAVLFLGFTFVAGFDAFVEPLHGGWIVPHIIGGFLALSLSYIYWAASRGREV